jgi:orotate phosphoribosyltransferase
VCVIDREAGGAKNLAEVDVELRALYTMRELEDAAG